jgi:endonuclease YncB( thermonuclease family)
MSLTLETVITLEKHGLPFNFLTCSVEEIVDVPYKDKMIKARLLHVVDGDTVCVAIHCGHMLKLRVRLADIDTPELHPKGEDKVGEALAAEKVKQYVCSLFIPHSLVTIKLLKVDKYGGRYVGHLYMQSGETLSQHLLTKGYAKSYKGKAKQPWIASDFDMINATSIETDLIK